MDGGWLRESCTRVVRLVVREDANGLYAYDLQRSQILSKKNPAIAGIPVIQSGARREAGFEGDPSTVRARQPGEPTGVTVAQLRDVVNAEGREGWQWLIDEQMRSPQFAQWFGQSKVVDAEGKPKVVYHGTAEEFWAFGTAGGRATNPMSAPLGFYFAEKRKEAVNYAKNASRGVPAQERVVDALLSIQNPYSLTSSELSEFDSQAGIIAFRAWLGRLGHDGVHITDVRQWVAFEPGQIKSASRNNGEFDRANADLRFSKPDPDAVLGAVDARSQGLGEGLAARLKDTFRGLKPENLRENTRPAWLGALTLRHLAELGGDIKLRQVGAYADRVQRMATDRNTIQKFAFAFSGVSRSAGRMSGWWPAGSWPRPLPGFCARITGVPLATGGPRKAPVECVT